MRTLRHYADIIVLILCVLLFLGSAVWAAMSFRRLDVIAGLNATGPATPVHHVPTVAQVPTIARVSWPEPPPQSRGSDWLYDVFTPPMVYYDPRTQEFTVTRPDLNVVVASATESPFEVELVSVRQEPYRIQLVGILGDEPDLHAVLENVETGGVELGRPGAVFPPERGDFTLRSFEVRRVTTASTDSMPLVDEVGFAIVLDGRTGREVTLTNRERLMMPRLQCVLRTRAHPPEEHPLREGMKITVNGFDYLVMQLSLNPAQAVVSRRPTNSIGGAETRTLVPVGGAAAATRDGAATAPRDISIDSPRVSLFSSTRHKPLVVRIRLSYP